MGHDQERHTLPEVFTPAEIAGVAGVPVARVLQLVASGAVRTVAVSRGLPETRSADALIAFADAVAAVLALREGSPRPPGIADGDSHPLLFSAPTFIRRSPGLPIVVSGTLHAGVVVCVLLVTSFGMTPEAATRIDRMQDERANMRLVLLALPGPGGGGGGGGTHQRALPPRAERKGPYTISSPIPARRDPAPIVAIEYAAEPPEPPPLESEPLPPIIAPVVIAPGNQRDRIGVLEQTSASVDSRGPGAGGGVGNGWGTGLGDGEGPGLGPGSGGGTGGGPYRPGGGLTPPQLLREIKADYTEDARQQGVTGEVVLEIVVRQDGTVGDVRLMHGLPCGLNDRAIQAVRRWRFAPARRLGQPIDVVVEVAVEFKLR